ncbi:hypothetical protein P153DRAFT_385432 [Dothidotthia symphoricarpi CBS 119687]|uniref:Uncharacterized protein n=1 Tax=Dothidotthia symphoricarpi CBS 119687 TaxID=1392245 RepID=A0A6A6AD69_9PLEO|nr:uncharacterized protein P153DRAFT_385432 [Dothidotthia symphoricarpi CBS 119687]KAF2129213.1 hypothetical protein P153DRAFT_385432 [Dothidotthia symphoricarpi CBS 119687]
MSHADLIIFAVDVNSELGYVLPTKIVNSSESFDVGLFQETSTLSAENETLASDQIYDPLRTPDTPISVTSGEVITDDERDGRESVERVDTLHLCTPRRCDCTDHAADNWGIYEEKAVPVHSLTQANLQLLKQGSYAASDTVLASSSQEASTTTYVDVVANELFSRDELRESPGWMASGEGDLMFSFMGGWAAQSVLHAVDVAEEGECVYGTFVDE